MIWNILLISPTETPTKTKYAFKAVKNAHNSTKYSTFKQDINLSQTYIFNNIYEWKSQQLSYFRTLFLKTSSIFFHYYCALFCLNIKTNYYVLWGTNIHCPVSTYILPVSFIFLCSGVCNTVTLKVKLSHCTPWSCLGGRGSIAPTQSWSWH
jgi:hypothetical protein